jgi:3',5'-cyclic AMP phosphodiesterase CpdA
MALIAHLSDVHLGPLPDVGARDLMSKRLLGYLNWRRNRERAYDPDILAAILADLRAARPDHIAVTGDLVNIALPREIAGARTWLEALGAPGDVSLVPGNHDAYVPAALPLIAEAWQPFTAGDTPGDAPFPYIRRRGQLALIGVSTAIASAPLMATGRIDTEQAQRLGLALAATGRQGLCRIVMIHHPPTHRASAWPRRLIGAPLVRHAIRRFGAELVLHGHNHRTSVAYLEGTGRDVPVVGAAAPGTRPHGNRPGGSYNLFKIVGEPGNYVIGMFERGWRDGAIETISKRLLAGDQPTATQA